jgi:hypothetical protein
MTDPHTPVFGQRGILWFTTAPRSLFARREKAILHCGGSGWDCLGTKLKINSSAISRRTHRSASRKSCLRPWVEKAWAKCKSICGSNSNHTDRQYCAVDSMTASWAPCSHFLVYVNSCYLVGIASCWDGSGRTRVNRHYTPSRASPFPPRWVARHRLVQNARPRSTSMFQAAIPRW